MEDVMIQVIQKVEDLLVKQLVQQFSLKYALHLPQQQRSNKTSVFSSTAIS